MNDLSARNELLDVANAFLTAFDHLDWEIFTDFIAPDATIFMPWPTFPKRLEGKAEIEAAFRPFFESLPQERQGPPYLHLSPMDLEANRVGDVGFVTFHLDEVDHFGRRTAVFKKQNNQWRLIHLHASNMPPLNG